LAQKLQGKEGIDVFVKAKSSSDIMRVKKRLNVQTDEDRLRSILGKVGKTGL
jgi:hypothetical protein